jgi:hypothetical protein
MTNLTIVASDGLPVVERIKPKERDGVVQALRAGVVPRTGVQHVQVGRVNEVKQAMLDIDRITDQGSTVRFIIGDYGSGKTFFLSLARSIAIQRKLVVVHADLSPERRIHASGGHARSLYAELMRNMATRTKPEGGALGSVVERFIGDAQTAAKASGSGLRPSRSWSRATISPLPSSATGAHSRRATRRARRRRCDGCGASMR